MNETVLKTLLQRLRSTNGYLLKVTEDLTGEQLATAPGPTSPPIGWHLWHISRWADRFQASFSQPLPSDPNQDMWHTENLATAWGLDPARLGVHAAGPGMEYDQAAALPRTAGRENLLGYARRAFAASEEALAGLSPAELDQPRPSIREFEIIDEVMQPAPAQETTYLADIIFHLIHANRHLGMIEALRGLLLDRPGSVKG